MKRLKGNKGITLIALIITIIVMLILVGVTVTVALNGGLFSKAKIAAEGTQLEIDREALLSAVIGAIGNDATVDFSKLDNNLPNGFTGSDGIYTSSKGNCFKVSVNGEIEYIELELEVEKIVREDDEEYAYWKTNGNGTIVYWDYPEDKEVPETLIVPCQIGNEKIKTIGELALCGLRVQRNEDGTLIKEIDNEGYEQPVLLDTVTDENDMPIPTGQIAKVKEIIISKGIEEIRELAVAFDTSLKYLTVPSTLSDIAEEFLGECTSLDTVKVSEGTTKIFSNEFAGLNIKKVILPRSLIEIGENAFYSCVSLENITILENVYKIGKGAFEYCYSLKTINILGGVKIIEESAFSSCNSLESINIPIGLTTIGQEAFYRCTSIKYINIPETVDNMGYGVFYGWTNEQTINMGKVEEPALNTERYCSVGWEAQWWQSCNAKIEWGKIK